MQKLINLLILSNQNTYLHFRINPQSEAAKKGLDRLEKQMKVCIICFVFGCVVLAIDTRGHTQILLYLLLVL